MAEFHDAGLNLFGVHPGLPSAHAERLAKYGGELVECDEAMERVVDERKKCAAGKHGTRECAAEEPEFDTLANAADCKRFDTLCVTPASSSHVLGHHSEMTYES